MPEDPTGAFRGCSPSMPITLRDAAGRLSTFSVRALEESASDPFPTSGDSRSEMWKSMTSDPLPTSCALSMMMRGEAMFASVESDVLNVSCLATAVAPESWTEVDSMMIGTTTVKVRVADTESM